MRIRKTVAVAFVLTSAASALADPPPLGAPPPDATALVAAPKAAEDAPTVDKATDNTTATVSAGGQLSTGNSRLLAGTANGAFGMRRGADGFGAGVLANYGEGAAPGQKLQTTAENVQGRARYDRYVSDPLSLFLIGTARHDRFQGLDVRFNVDPGAKYLFVNTDPTKFWGELGYDFQYDVRRDDARVQPPDAAGQQLPLLAKTASDHSARLFIGLKHSFNSEVTFTTGVEYLQSLVETTRARLNYDALFAANVGGGMALGLGFSARYDHDPLPGKKDLDTATTVSLIYAFSAAPTAAAAATPVAAPAPAAPSAPPPAENTPPVAPPQPAAPQEAVPAAPAPSPAPQTAPTPPN